MDHHYIVQTLVRTDHGDNQEFLCPMGAICKIDELGFILKQRRVTRYRIKAIDREPVADWEQSEWVSA